LEQALHEDAAQGRDGAVVIGCENLGHVRRTLAQFDLAEQAYRRALETAERIGCDEAAADQYRHLGQLHADRNDLAAAEPLLLKGFELEEGLGRTLQLAEVAMLLGGIYVSLELLDKACSRYEQAIGWFEQLGQTPQVVQALISLGSVAHTLGDGATAEGRFRRGLDLAELIRDEDLVAGCCENLAMSLLLQRRNPSESRGYQRRAVEIFERAGRVDRLADVYENVGNVRMMLGDTAGAEHDLRRAAEYYTELGQTTNLGDVLTNIATLALARQRADQAEEVLRHALKVTPAEEHLRRGRALEQLATVCAGTRRADEAFRLLEGALDELSQAGDVAKQARVLRELGALCIDQGELSGGREMLERGLRLAQQAEDMAEIAESQRLLGQIAILSGQFAPARQYCQEALASFEALGREDRVAEMLGNLGVIHVSVDQLVQAETFLRRSVERYEPLESPADLAEARRNLAVVLGMQRRLDEAQAECESAIKAVTSQSLPEPLANLYDTLASVCQARGSAPAARENQQRAISWAEQTGDAQLVQAFRQKLEEM